MLVLLSILITIITADHLYYYIICILYKAYYTVEFTKINLEITFSFSNK